MDPQRAVSATVDATGGTLEAPIADGSVLRLILPKGAVTHPVTVRLVPLARLDHFSVRGARVLDGVQIEPMGLVLEQPARLELLKSRRAPALAFSFDAGGRDAHLVPSARKGGFAALLAQFGGYAITAAAHPAATATRVPLPADPDHRIEQAITQVLLGGRPPAARIASQTATPASVSSDEEVRALMTSYYETEIRPELVKLASSTLVDPDTASVPTVRLLVNLQRLGLRGFDRGAQRRGCERRERAHPAGRAAYL